MNEIQANAAQIRKRLRYPPNGHTSGEIEILPEYVVQKAKAKAMIEARQAQYDARRRAELEAKIAAAQLAYEERKAAITLAMLERPPRRPTITLIIDVVSKKYSVSELDIRSHCRTKPLVLPRHVCIYLARHLTEWSFPRIGENLGRRDHTSVLYAVEKITQRVKDDLEFALEIEDMRRQIMRRVNP